MFGRAAITLGIGPHSSLGFSLDLGLLFCDFFAIFPLLFVLLCYFSFFTTKPRDWLGRTSPK